MEPLIYTPQAPAQTPVAPTQFQLVEDVTGKPLPKHGPQTLIAVRYQKDTKSLVKTKKGQKDQTERRIELKFNVPHPPVENCKACHGKGYVGWIRGRLQICGKCYSK